jgi:glycosyltransferase involved in cell wall biosynthesis
MLAIAIPAYDMHSHGVHFLRRALDSIAKQSDVDFAQIEVVISDHSVDFAIEQFLASYQAPFKLHYVRNGTQFGNISHNVNHATQFVLQNCSSSFIKILFQDDFLLEDGYLSQLIDIAKNQPDAIITGATHSDDGNHFYNPINPHNNPFLIFGQNSISSPSTLTLSRAACERLPCDEQVKLFMDIDWYYRLFKEFKHIVFAPQLLVVNGVWEGQAQHQFDTQAFIKELSYVLAKYEADNLRAQIPSYLTMLHEQYPEHANLIDPLVRPLMDTSNTRIAHITEQFSDTEHSNIDVILTTQNAAQHINFSIRNALLQSVPPRTIYVIDAHSLDGTANMVSSIYAQIPAVRFVSSVSVAIEQAREEGLTLSNAPYIAFLDCTAENHPSWSANYLEQQIACLQSQKDAIGSLGEICTSESANDALPLLVQLPACGYASNILVRKETALADAQFLEQLRLAEEHHQWQLFATHFSLLLADLALTYTSSLGPDKLQLQPKYSIEQCQNIFIWWSKNYQAIQSTPKLLTLIRQAFTSTATAPKLTLIRRMIILHDTYHSLMPALNVQLFYSACGSYNQLRLDIVDEHYKQLWIGCKKAASKFPLIVKMHQVFSR